MDILKELFPHIKDHELEQYLNSAASDLDLCVSMILSDPDNLSHNDNDNDDDNNDDDTFDMGKEQTLAPSHQFEELKSMFPKLDPKIIESVFQDENGKISNVITHLLNLEYINNETTTENPVIPVLLDSQNTFKQRKKNTNQWQNTYNDIDILTGLLNWNNDQSLLIQLYHENQFSVIKTLISIILKEIHAYQLPSPTSSISIATSKGKRFSRVQNNTGFAHNRNINVNENENENKSILNSNSNNNKKSSRNEDENENQNENLYISYEEYLSLIKQDKHCDGINPQFISKLFEYFQSNESKTNIHYCHKILQYILDDPNGIALTFNKYTNETAWNLTSNKSKRSTTSTKSDSDICNSIEIQSIYKDPKINNIFETYKLDFHGFTPRDAIIVLNNVMNKWWDEELKLRELNNYNMKQQRVTCLEPLILVTGRGIHSIGGKSPVRFQVKRYLQLNGYLFNEKPAYFEVYGKQKKEYIKK